MLQFNRSFLVPVLTALLSVPSAAQETEQRPASVPGPLRVERRANQFERSAQNGVAVAHDDTGATLLTWQSRRQQEGTYGIYGRRFDGQGRPLGDEVQINANARSMQMQPAVSLDSSGHAWFAWRSFGHDGDRGAIMARRFAPDLGTATAEVLVNQEKRGHQTEPVIVALSDGDALVAWLSPGEQGRPQILARRLGSDGLPAGDAFRVDSGEALGHGPPSMACTSGDEVIVAYSRVDVDGRPIGVFARRLDGDVLVGEEWRVDCAQDAQPIEPSVAASPSGEILIGWLEVEADGYGIRLRRYSREGDRLEAQAVQVLEQSGPGYLSGLSVALSEQGQGLAAWNRHADGPKLESGLFASLLSRAGAALDEPFRVTATESGTQSIAVAHGAGRVFLEDSGLMGFAWHGDAGQGDSSGANLTLLAPHDHEFAPLEDDSTRVAQESLPGLDEGARPHDPPSFDARNVEDRPDGPPTYGVDDYFLAFSNTGWTPPDPEMAVGMSHIVCMVNGGIAGFTKDGTLVFQQDINGSSGFFGSVGAGTFVFDPEVIWDPHTDRFIAFANERNNGKGRFLFAVSDDGDPSGTWHTYFINGGPLVNDTDIDSPNISVDASVIYMGADYFGPDKYLVVMVDKASVINGGKKSFTSTVISGRQSFGMPVNYDTGTPIQYLLWANEFTTSSSVRLYAITDPLGTPTTQFTTLTVPSYSHPADPPQKGTSSRPELFEARFWSTMIRDGQLWATHHQGSSRTTARWYQIDLGGWPNSGSPSLVQSGDVDLGSGIWTFFPSIWADADQNMAMTFARSASNEYISMNMVYRIASDPLGTLRAPEMVQAGQGTNTSGRWGDYSATNDDPADPGVFWGHHEHRPSNSSWNTLVAKLTTCDGSIQSYCTANPNSTGNAAKISASGSTSISDNNLTLMAINCPAKQFGIFFYGQGQTQKPLGDGFLCISGGFARLPVVQVDAFGQVFHPLDLNNLPPSGPISPGESWDFQFWYRDKTGGPAGYNFSDAIEISFCQ